MGIAKKYSQAEGFSALITFGVVMILAGVGFIGWLVWDKYTGRSSQQTSNNSVSDPSEGGKYLVIKEWGVRFLLPEELRGDIYYTPDKNKSDTMVIDSKSFPAGSECVSISLAKTAKKIENLTDPQGFNSSSVASIDGHFYSRITGVIACSDSQEKQEKAAQIQRQLYDATSNIEKYSHTKED